MGCAAYLAAVNVLCVCVCVLGVGKCRDSEVQVGLACSRMSRDWWLRQTHEGKGSEFLKAGSRRESLMACYESGPAAPSP